MSNNPKTNFNIFLIMHGDDKKQVADFSQAVRALIGTHTSYHVSPGGGPETVHSMRIHGEDQAKLRELYEHLALLAHMSGLRATPL
jgi:hypothetical protein